MIIDSFNIHGEWDIEICGNVVLQTLSGEWNEEAIIAYMQDFRLKVAPLAGKKWAILSVLEDWGLGIPEINKHAEEHCKWFIANGCTKDAHVYTESAFKQMLLDKIVPQTDEKSMNENFLQTDLIQ